MSVNVKKLHKFKKKMYIFDPSDRKDSTSTGPTKFEVQIMAQFDNHNSQVWRVSWNITSTLLASSGDDGCVRLWKGWEDFLVLPAVNDCSFLFISF